MVKTQVGDLAEAADMGFLAGERARYEKLLDSMTGLPRWALLIDRTAVALARARRHGRDVAVFVLEYPHFPTGPYDARRVAEVLLSRLRPDDTLARLGPRRFAVVCNDIGEDEDAATVAHRLVYGSGLECGLGVAVSDDVDPPEAVIGRALVAALGINPDIAA
jgi:GGDEF domain-containing protein